MDLIALLGISQLPQGVSTTFYFDGQTVQLAYQLSASSSPNVPANRLFTSSSDIPASFSIAVTAKLTARSIGRNWCIMKAVSGSNVSLSVEVHGQSQELGVRVLSRQGLQEVKVQASRLFDEQWHRIVVSVDGRNVKWIVDCDLIGHDRLPQSPLALAHEGTVFVGVRRSNSRGVAVAFQDLGFFCTPLGAEQRQCDRVCT